MTAPVRKCIASLHLYLHVCVHTQAEMESPALLASVVAAVRDCPGSCVLLHYPRSGGEARMLKERLAKDDLTFASLIVLEGEHDELLRRIATSRKSVPTQGTSDVVLQCVLQCVWCVAVCVVCCSV